jgi:hypothetical protein
MRVGVIRTGGRPSIRADATAIEPRLDVASFPDSPARTFGVALSAVISAFRVLRPIQRKAIANQPFAEIGAANRTGRDRPSIWVEAQRQAINRTTIDEGVEVVCSLRAAAILQTVLAAAQLAALRRVDAPEPDAHSMNFQRIAINDAGLTNKIIRQRRARNQQKHQYQCSALDHDVGFQRLSQIARIEFRPILERFKRRQVFRPLGIVKLRAT